MASPSPSQPFGFGQPSGGGGLGMSALGLQQQSQRSLNNQQFSSRLSASGSHIPGHVTPTSSGIANFPTSLANSLPPQPHSPNSLMSMSSRGLPSRQQLVPEVKRLMGIGLPVGGMDRMDISQSLSKGPLPTPRGGSSMGAMSTFGLSHSRGFSHGIMGSALDLSEFPSLSNRAQQESSSAPNLQSNPMAGRPAYVGMVKQPTSESNEFQIHNEDFPALPGSQNQDLSQDFSKSGLTENKEGMRFPGDKVQGHKRGIQTTKDGRVTNIPPGMVTDQFGMVGLLTFIRVAESDPNLVSLALGSDLTTLGLNLNSPENLYPTFGGPWADHPCRPQDIEYPVPSEYLINQSIRDKLAPLKLNRYGEDLLFFLFYMYTGDILQLASAIELYNREWRFHKDERVWITRAPGMGPTEKTNTYERGTYYFFDVVNWRKVAKEFHLDYERLEERPTMPPFSIINV